MNDKMNTRDVPRPLHHSFPPLDGRDVQGPRLPGSALRGGKVRLGQDLNGKGERDNAVKTLSEPICNVIPSLDFYKYYILDCLYVTVVQCKQQHVNLYKVAGTSLPLLKKSKESRLVFNIFSIFHLFTELGNESA